MEIFWATIAGAAIGASLVILSFHHFFRRAFLSDMKKELEKMWKEEMDTEDDKTPSKDKIVKTVTIPAEKMQELLDRLDTENVSMALIKEAFDTLTTAHIEQRKKVWDEIARLAGYENERAVRSKGCVISIDLPSESIIIKEKDDG